MPYVDESNFDVAMPAEQRNEYWRRVKFALRSYFNASEGMADRFRESVETGSVEGQLLVYHRDSLSVAADLADAADTLDRHVEDYRRRFSDASTP